MIAGLLWAFALQAVPSATANWLDVTAPGDESPTWIDTTSIRGPRTHREVVLRLVDGPTKGYGYVSSWVDCETRWFTVTAIRTIDADGKVVSNQQFAPGEAPSKPFTKDDDGFAGRICA